MHSLRHGGATELAAAGFPQYIISTFGGLRAKFSSIAQYTRLSGVPTNSSLTCVQSRFASHSAGRRNRLTYAPPREIQTQKGIF